MNVPKLIKTWISFRNEYNSIKMICDIPSQIKVEYDKIDLAIDSMSKNEEENDKLDNDLFTPWEQLYKLILDPSHFFEINQIINVLKQKEKILKAHIDIKIEDVENFSLFIMALEGLQNSWKNYLLHSQISQPLSQYNILIGDMYSFFNKIFTEPQHHETSKDLSGIQTALFSLQSMMTNFQLYIKLINSANLVQAEFSPSKK